MVVVVVVVQLCIVASNATSLAIVIPTVKVIFVHLYQDGMKRALIFLI